MKLQSTLPDDFYYSFKLKVCFTLSDFGLNYIAIDKSKLFAEKLRNYSNPYQRYMFSTLLFDMRDSLSELRPNSGRDCLFFNDGLAL